MKYIAKYIKKWQKSGMWLLKFLLLGVASFGTLAQAEMIYASSQNAKNISVIYSSNHTVVATVALGGTPLDMEVNPCGTRIYQTDLDNNTVKVIDTNTNAVIATIPVGTTPEGVVSNASGTRVYVANNISNDVSVIDTSTNSVIATIPVGTGSGPSDVAVNFAGTLLYVTDLYVSKLTVIDLSTNGVIATVPAGNSPRSIALNPTGTRAYIANYSSNTISVIDTSTNGIISTIAVGTNPSYVTVNPAGTRAYVSNVTSSNVSVIDTSNNTVIATVLTGNRPYSITINQDGTRAYIANTGSNNVSTMDTSSNSIIATVPVLTPMGLAITNGAVCNTALYDAGRKAGIQQCTANPNSCGITKIDSVSTNAFVSPTIKLISGVLISGGVKRSMVRASSVNGAVDPMVEIYTYPDRKLLGSNDSWATDPGAAELTQKKLTPAHATDAAMIISLPPGLFTAEVTSKNGGSGNNVLEIYDMAVFQ